MAADLAWWCELGQGQTPVRIGYVVFIESKIVDELP
jgi:hypothetical protein